ncbi:DNA alkylation repair protein [Candidatus Micrarchaeota archaeon]|nr:DNA alkylation repair protein [Candidatus Micrarchaeota archaeon]
MKTSHERTKANAAAELFKKNIDTQAILDELDQGEFEAESKLEAAAIIHNLKKLQNHANAAGMKRFGITGGQVLGIPVPVLRQMAKQTGRNHALAQELWQSGIHEARLLASMVGEPEQLTSETMDAWMRDFDSWDVCDQTCGNLFDKNPLAWKKAIQWAHHENEFERRAGFALMATLAWHEKAGKVLQNAKAGKSMHAGTKTDAKTEAAVDKKFEAFFPLIVQYATDERNFVKKAVNWALRQIGKRNPVLKRKAVRTAETILKTHPKSKAARFIANDALNELQPNGMKRT